MSAAQIGIGLKGRRNGRGWSCRCPVPGHGKGRGDGSPSLSVHDGDDGRLLLRCFAGCEFLDILDALRRLGLVDDQPTLDRAGPILHLPAQVNHQPDRDALQTWRNAKSAVGTIVAQYLERRGIPITPRSIRCSEHLHLGRYYMPAMIAAVQLPDGAVVAVQSTILTPKGDKAAVAVPKVTTGALGCGAVRFAAAAEVMGLAEGCETALSAQLLSEVPTWASLGSHRLHRVKLPEIVREVHVFGDNDEPGRAAAQRTSAVHMALGRRVVLRFPPDGLNDFNDLLNADADEMLRDLRPASMQRGLAA